MAVLKTSERTSSGTEVTMLEAEIECELATLAAIQTRYDYLRAKLESRPDQMGDKALIAEQLAARLRKQRQQHVLRLADLHDRRLSSSLYSAIKFPSETRH